jgi:catechol 2,3-dioxygenase-like lactoylglutathione lyase family enzyme
MTVHRMDHVGIIVEDLAAAIEFFVDLGLELEGETSMEGESVDRLIGLEGVQTDFAFVRAPDGHGLELIKFRSPSSPDGDPHAPAHAPGLRHITFAVDDLDAVAARLQGRGAELVGEVVRYENSYKLCYIRGPEGIIVELAEKLG